MNDIIELYEKLSFEKELPKQLLIFQNETNAEFIESEALIPVAVDSFQKLSFKYERIKVAVWQTEPVKTAYSFIFKKTFDLHNFEIEIFYTEKAALKWLKS